MSLAGHLRSLWAERSECLDPRIPGDMPSFCLKLALSDTWRAAAVARAGAIEGEIDELLKTLRDLGIAEVRRAG